MTDIVERLRDWPRMTPVACKEAADEIERLRGCLTEQRRNYEASGIALTASLGEIERLRAALREAVAIAYGAGTDTYEALARLRVLDALGSDIGGRQTWMGK